MNIIYLGERETDRSGFIKGLVNQYGALEKKNSPADVRDILQPVFNGMQSQERRELRYELQILMMQWNYFHPGKESDNSYASLFHYLDLLE